MLVPPKKAPYAVHVLDHFHIVPRMSKALDKGRAAEARRLKDDGYEPVLKQARWLPLKRPEKQTAKLREILRDNLRSV